MRSSSDNPDALARAIERERVLLRRLAEDRVALAIVLARR